jgi:outer membrane murein-binding lipoprotein Lpp
MTEQEKQEVIEKAAPSIYEAMRRVAFDANRKWPPAWVPRGNALMQNEARRHAQIALEAVGYFDLRAKLDALVEAGEAAVSEFKSLQDEGAAEPWDELNEHATLDDLEDKIRALRTTLTAAKDQSHD